MNKKLILEAWRKVEDQLSLARRFLGEGRVDEALYFVWIAVENLVNTLKVSINGRYVKDHREKSLILLEYYALGILKRDYSKLMEKLAKYRIAAEFHPYTAIPRDYSEDDVIKYIEEVDELKKEVEGILKSKGVLE